MNALHTKQEQAAMSVSTSPALLRKRLNAAKACLLPKYKALFKDAVVDFENKRLLGDGCILQWLLRPCPGLPEGPDNQQTSIGVVYFFTV